MVGVWAHRHALHSCPRCCVVVPYCRRVVVAHRSRMWLSRTINNDERRPLSLFVVWLPRRPVATWHQLLVLITKGGGRAVSIDYSPTTETTNDLLFVV